PRLPTNLTGPRPAPGRSPSPLVLHRRRRRGHDPTRVSLAPRASWLSSTGRLRLTGRSAGTPVACRAGHALQAMTYRTSRWAVTLPEVTGRPGVKITGCVRRVSGSQRIGLQAGTGRSAGPLQVRTPYVSVGLPVRMVQPASGCNELIGNSRAGHP